MGENFNWNTYSGVGFNRLLKLPEKYEMRIAMFIPDTNQYTSKIYFSGEHETEDGQVMRILHHSPQEDMCVCSLPFTGIPLSLPFPVELGCDVPGIMEGFDEGYMSNIGSDPFYIWGTLLLSPPLKSSWMLI